MNRLEELIQKLCPEGVEYKKIGEFGRIAMCKRILKSQTSADGEIPFYKIGTFGGVADSHISKELFEEYSKKYSYPKKGNILISAAGTIGRTVVFDGTPSYFQDSNIVWLEHDNTIVTDRYLMYVYETKPWKTSDGGTIARLYNDNILKTEIPVPPLEVQREIVRVLDHFTLLRQELSAEYSKREEQNRCCRLEMVQNVNTVSEKYSISDICVVEKGRTPIQKAVPGEYPLVVTTSERKKCDTYQFDGKAVCIPLVSSRGHGVASLNHVYYQEGKFALGNILCALLSKDESICLTQYLYYYFEDTKDYSLVPLMKGGANVALHMEDIERVNVPVPALAVQERIINTCKKMDEYLSLLNSEIEARQKQYEYYRDKLLSFPRKETA